MTNKSLYSILGLTAEATPSQIETAYAGLLAKISEDGGSESRGGDSQARLIAIKEAYSVLSDPVRRQAYNRKLFANEAVPALQGPVEVMAFDSHSSRSHKLLWLAGLALAGVGMALYFQHQHEALRVQQEMQLKQLELVQKAQAQAAEEAEARAARLRELDQRAEAARQAQFREAQRQQDARWEAALIQRDEAQRLQAQRDSDNRQRAQAIAAQQQAAREKALMRQLEVEQYGHVITR